MKKRLAGILTLSMAMGLIVSAQTAVKADEGEKIIIQVGYENAPGELIDLACQEWQKSLEEMSEGTMEIQLFPSSQLGSKDEIIDQMQAGSNVITLINGGIYADRGINDFGITFSPYLFSSWEDVEKLTASDWWAEQCEQVEEIGMKVLSAWHYGARHTLTKTKVEHASDFAGMKIRVPSNTYQIKGQEAMGATPTPLDLSEVYTALQQGTIDGLENPLTTLEGGAFQEVAKYLILDGHIYDETTWACGTIFFDTLTEEQQNWLIESSKEAGLWNNEQLQSANEEALERMIEGGVEVVDIDLEEFQAAAESYYEDPELTEKWSEGLVERVKAILAE